MNYDMKVRLVREEFTRNLPLILEGRDPYFKRYRDATACLRYQAAVFGEVSDELEDAA